MRKTLITATVAFALVLSQGAIAAEPKTSTSDEIVAGEVTNIDTKDNRITIRSSDGVIHEFEAAKATLDGLKVGDVIEARKRPDPK